MRYYNLDLVTSNYEMSDSGEVFKVSATSMLGGDTRMPEQVMVPAGLRNSVQLLDQKLLSLPQLIKLGEQLADLLFPPSIREILKMCFARLGDDSLRIRLSFDASPLADLPWEYMFMVPMGTPDEQKDISGFIALDPKFSIVRYQRIAQPRISLDVVADSSIRFVMVMSNPEGQRYPKLNLEREQEVIKEALKGVGAIVPEFHSKVTVDDLQKVLIKSMHIFHFAGHGDFDTGFAEQHADDVTSVDQQDGALRDAKVHSESDSLVGKGYLILVDKHQHAVPFDALKLALNLRSRNVRLVVLGACDSGRRGENNPWTGVATALIEVGIPAVVGMQFTIQDRNAIVFSQGFYQTLAQGEPIDAAVTNGRLAIFTSMHHNPNDHDWGVPVLYLRTDEVILFPTALPFVSQAPSTQPQPIEQSRLFLAPGTEGFVGRKIEFDQLTNWIEQRHVRVIGIFGIGGIGKTRLIGYLAHKLPLAAFEYVLWLSLEHAPPVIEILRQAVQFFSHQSQLFTSNDIYEGIALLISQMNQHRCLLILDGLESVIAETHPLEKYQQQDAAYRELLKHLSEGSHQSCVAVTSQEKPDNFDLLQRSTRIIQFLELSGLQLDDIHALLGDEEIFGEEADLTTVQNISANSGA